MVKENFTQGDTLTYQDANAIGRALNTLYTIAEYTTDTGGFSGPVPSGVKGCRVELIGAGGGGGSGCYAGGQSNRCGGGGGAGGNTLSTYIPAAALGSTFTVAVGNRGTGGAPQLSSGAGSAGTAGGDASFTSGALTLTASGGGGGIGGGTGNSTPGGEPGRWGDFIGSPGAIGRTSNAVSASDSPITSGGTRQYGGAAGGGGGGGAVANNGGTSSAGGDGGRSATSLAGVGATNADDATSGGSPIAGFPGAGAGGGRISSATSSRQRGANGVGYGSGGGGGAGSQTDYGLGSGRGGNGGPAYVRVIWAF